MATGQLGFTEQLHDLDDVLQPLNLTTVDEALEVVTRDFDASSLPAKTRLALDELLGGG